MMTPSSKRPTERPPPHSRSAWQNIWVGLLVFVVGSGLVWVLQSVFFGGDPSEVNVNEPGEVNVNEPGEVNVNEPGEVNVNEPGEVNVEEPGEVIISGPATVIIEQPAATEPPEPPEPTPEPTAGDLRPVPCVCAGPLAADGDSGPLGADESGTTNGLGPTERDHLGGRLGTKRRAISH